MWDQEKHHLATFDKLIPEHRARPTALLPFWNVAGFALGAGTALLGKEGAMACTVAVEASITSVGWGLGISSNNDNYFEESLSLSTNQIS